MANGSVSSRPSQTGLDLTTSTTNSLTVDSTDAYRTIGRFKLRGKTDDLPQDWWFASTAIPLVAATIGPLANVLSIAALVTKWRDELPNNGQLPEGTDDNGVGIEDPKWEVILNAISLACGFFGNICLLLNFTKRIRYIIALPLTIITWYFATGILIGILVAMNTYEAPIRPGQTYSQGFWHAVIAATLYLIGSTILMVNMLGYFLGHYPQHFDLDDDQRTLILQTMMFFFWLAGGAAVFVKLCGFTYADSLYFCDATILTVGFGDYVPTNNASRGFLFPYAVMGIIFLGLMINSIRKFAVGMSKDKVIKSHQLHERERTFGRSVTNENELRERLGLPPRKPSTAGPFRRQSLVSSLSARRESLNQYGHFDVQGRKITFHERRAPGRVGRRGVRKSHKSKRNAPAPSRDAKLPQQANDRDTNTKRAKRRERLILLKEEKDRFDAMREIQAHTSRFKQYYALCASAFAFGILWCVGAVVFMVAEHRIQGLTYFEALYFCYVSLLTIGYGDFSPRSNAGKPFFIVWSLIAVPTMTILISAMGRTIVAAVNRGTFKLADWTIMPKAGVWRDFLENHTRLRAWLEQKTNDRLAEKRIKRGFTLRNPDNPDDLEVGGGDETADDEASRPRTLEKLAEEPAEQTEHDLARRLASAIKRTANDLRLDHNKKYSYEEWVEFTRLIRFSRYTPDEVELQEEEEGLVDWDWIGEDSPMLADIPESEWVLDRLCESLTRYTRKQSLAGRNDMYSRSKLALTTDGSYEKGKGYMENPADIYPAHPWSRSKNRTVLQRCPEGMMITKVHSEPGYPPHNIMDGVAGQRDSGSSGSGNGSGSGSLSATVGSGEYALEKELYTGQVRDWAIRVKTGGCSNPSPPCSPFEAPAVPTQGSASIAANPDAPASAPAQIPVCPPVREPVSPPPPSNAALEPAAAAPP